MDSLLLPICPNSKISVPHQDDHQIQNVPDAAEVMKPVDVELQDLLYHVVEDEDTEDDLTANDKEVPVADIVDQLHCSYLPGWDDTSCSWKLHHQSVEGGGDVWWGLGWDTSSHPLLFPPPTKGYTFGYMFKEGYMFNGGEGNQKPWMEEGRERGPTSEHRKD